MRLLFALFLLPFVAPAQSLRVGTAFAGTVTNTPIAVQFFVPANLENVAYRWVASDVTNTTVTNWTDQIQGHNWTNGQNSARPIKTDNYITFDNTHWLTSAPPVISSNCAVGFIMNMIDPTASGGVHPGIWMGPGGGTCTTNYLGLGLDFNVGYDLRLSPGCGTFDYTEDQYGSLTNVVHDMLFWNATTNSSESGFTAFYTNGVVSASQSGSVTPLTRGIPTVLGRNIFRSKGPTMRIYEMWIWTNAFAATPSTINIVSNFHAYAANNYAP